MKKSISILFLFVLAVLFATCASAKTGKRIEMDNLLPLEETCTLEVEDGIIITSFDGDPDAFKPVDFWGTTVITRVPAGRKSFMIRYVVQAQQYTHATDKSFINQEFLPGHTYRLYISFNEPKVKDLGKR